MGKVALSGLKDAAWGDVKKMAQIPAVQRGMVGAWLVRPKVQLSRGAIHDESDEGGGWAVDTRTAQAVCHIRSCMRPGHRVNGNLPVVPSEDASVVYAVPMLRCQMLVLIEVRVVAITLQHLNNRMRVFPQLNIRHPTAKDIDNIHRRPLAPARRGEAPDDLIQIS